MIPVLDLVQVLCVRYQDETRYSCFFLSIALPLIPFQRNPLEPLKRKERKTNQWQASIAHVYQSLSVGLSPSSSSASAVWILFSSLRDLHQEAAPFLHISHSTSMAIGHTRPTATISPGTVTVRRNQQILTPSNWPPLQA